MSAPATIALDAGDLHLSGGLLALLRPALGKVEPGGIVAVLSKQPSVPEDLASWCRVERHELIGCESMGDGCDRLLVRRGELGVPEGLRETGVRIQRREGGRVTSADVLRTIPMPERADPGTGFAPRGARVEPGGPDYPFSLLERDRVAPPEVGQLYDQAVAAQWDGSQDVPWSEVGEHDPALEEAVGQVMTFLAENELSALYVPARFVSRIHPAYVEVAMLLAIQLADEARHIDVFLKRARIAGAGVGVSTATTSRSLRSLLDPDDFTESSFLLSVLGEGTFLDLLRFVEQHAPDACTAEIARRARNDESRHVHFGLAHVRHTLAHDPSLFGRLDSAVRRRSATLHGVGGVPAPVQDALTMLAAGSTDPRAIARGHDRFRELIETMHGARVKRLLHAGFSTEQAEIISGLHTPNFM
jgi:hypothetical protein